MRLKIFAAIAALLFVLSAGQVFSQGEGIIGPESYPENSNPLTGLPLEDPSALERRPLMVKIVNAPPEVRAKQHGLMQADIVWEHLLAGGITRFSAFYFSRLPEYIGPVRSLRLIDFEFARIYRALAVYSGMADGTYDILQGDDLMQTRLVGGVGPCPALCRTNEKNEKLEYTLYGNVPALYELANDRNRDVTPEPVYGMAFSEAIPAGGTAVEDIHIRYAQTELRWIYDPETARWLRESDGEAHFDAATGEQLNAANVVIIEEEHTEQPYVRENYWGPANFAFSVNFIGTGRAVLFRDGQYFEGAWWRATRQDPFIFRDVEGNVLPFKPGNTFFNLVPRWKDSYQLTFGLSDPAEAVVTVDSANLRWGPFSTYRVAEAAYRDDVLSVIGRNNSGSWIEVLFNEKVLWVSTELVQIDEVMNLPIARPTNED